MLLELEDKVALVYGAGGPIGGAVARAFARAGARVFLSGRTQGKLDRVAADIRSAGGAAETAVVDALDERAVDAYADDVARRAGGIDISFNLISIDDVQGTPLAEMSPDDFTRPVTTVIRTQFLTTRAAVRHMIRRGSGVILFFGGSGDPVPNLGGLHVAFHSLEGQRRQWASELGPYGVRVVTLETVGVPETLPEGFEGRDEIIASIEASSLLSRAPTLADVGDAAVFLASDRARTITATVLNLSGGAIID
jgi:NAD(P)-dependent dehydrogenase (short-subunit alcohol dehydrogenase family)